MPIPNATTTHTFTMAVSHASVGCYMKYSSQYANVEDDYGHLNSSDICSTQSSKSCHIKSKYYGTCVGLWSKSSIQVSVICHGANDVFTMDTKCNNNGGVIKFSEFKRERNFNCISHCISVNVLNTK